MIRRRRKRRELLTADAIRAMIDEQMADYYDVTAETAAEARKLWADHDTTEGRYDFGQFMTWLALQMIQELGPPFLTGEELLAKYSRYVRGETP